MNTWVNEFEYDLSLAPKKVPMDLILTDTKNFQNRKNHTMNTLYKILSMQY
jgi:hypothetical protein